MKIFTSRDEFPKQPRARNVSVKYVTVPNDETYMLLQISSKEVPAMISASFLPYAYMSEET